MRIFSNQTESSREENILGDEWIPRTYTMLHWVGE